MKRSAWHGHAAESAVLPRAGNRGDGEDRQRNRNSSTHVSILVWQSRAVLRRLRPRSVVCAALALTTVLGAACGTSSANQHGTALLAQGAVATGRFGFNSYTTGQVYGFALPLVRNASHETVVIQSVAVTVHSRSYKYLGTDSCQPRTPTAKSSAR